MPRRFLVFVALSMVAAAPYADAHETREVGPVEVVVGWANEPSFVGELNAVSLRVNRGETGVAGLEDDLQVDVSLGDASTGPLDLRPVFRDPGHYRADLIPTAPGAYTFHFTGSIDGEDFDETFTAGEGTFDEVHGTADIAFPQVAPSNAELAAAIDGLEPRLNALATEVDTDNNRIIALAGAVLAVVALAVALVRRRT